MVNVTFHGVRAAGGPPVGRRGERYGSHTTCVAVEVPKGGTILLDLGTGAARWAATTLTAGLPLAACALVTRAPGPSVAGLGGLGPGADLELYGPRPAAGRLADALAAGRTGPSLRTVTVEDEELAVGDAKVTVRTLAPAEGDVGPANGYRVEWDGVSVAYVNAAPALAAPDRVASEVLELADGADLFVAGAVVGAGADDAATAEHAVLAAREAGARLLALCALAPSSADDAVDRLVAGTRRTAERLGVDEVVAAAEGTTVSFDR
ncbi:MAG: hypothetical protein ABR511_01950 [Acidimicrobiales bacterium]